MGDNQTNSTTAEDTSRGPSRKEQFRKRLAKFSGAVAAALLMPTPGHAMPVGTTDALHDGKRASIEIQIAHQKSEHGGPTWVAYSNYSNVQYSNYSNYSNQYYNYHNYFNYQNYHNYLNYHNYTNYHNYHAYANTYELEKQRQIDRIYDSLP